MLGQSLRSAAPGRSVWGIEYDARLAEEASQKLERVITADLNRFDWGAQLSGGRFDCIIFADVLEHLLDPAAVLKASLSPLAPGGCVIVSLPNIRHVSALSSIFVGGTFPRRARGIFDSTHLRWFTYGDAAAMIAMLVWTVDASNHRCAW
jgi:2-polyprenyl-3-methyl-5-hydroxy-6-metoxy-1,4-benzoquinol methylase